MSQKDIEIQKDKVDSYLITTDITLLAAFLILLSINNGIQPIKILTTVAIITSLIALSLSLLFSLWHKYRISIRKSIFDDLKKEAVNKFFKQLESFRKIGKNEMLLSASEFLLANTSKNMTGDEIKNGMIKKIEEDAKKNDEEVEPLIESLAENAANNFSHVFVKAYKNH